MYNNTDKDSSLNALCTMSISMLEKLHASYYHVVSLKHLTVVRPNRKVAGRTWPFGKNADG
jgi:hypothetical protein